EDDEEPPELTEDDNDEEDITVKVMKLDYRAKLPKYQSTGAAGIDLATLHSVTLLPGESAVMDTGLAFQLPPNKVGVIKARSSAAKFGISIEGGVIDNDYTGEVRLIIRNQNLYNEITIKGGDRIAQMLILECPQYDIWQVHQFRDTERGDKGFGSTGGMVAAAK